MQRVEDITEALWGSKVSPGTISKLNQKVYVRIDEWHNRQLVGGYPYVYLEVIWHKRVNRKIRQRMRMAGTFPDGNSALMVVAARLRHIASTKWGMKRYMKMDFINKE